MDTSKRKIQIAVTGAVAVFFCLVMTLAVLIAIRISQDRVEGELLAREAALSRALAGADADAQYIASQKFIDEYGMKMYGRGRGKGIIFN